MLSDCGNSILYNAKLRSTALEAVAYGEFNIVTDIYLKSNRNILFGDKKASVQKTPTHSSQQIAVLRGHFCAKLLSDCKEFDPEFFFLHYYTYSLGQHINIFGALAIRTCSPGSHEVHPV